MMGEWPPMQSMSDSYLPGVTDRFPVGIRTRILVNERVSHCSHQTPLGVRVRPQLGGAVPLSDHEQRMLAEIERALYAEDPKFAASVRTTTLHSRYQRRIAAAITLVVAGLILLPVGLAIKVIPLGVLGFALMLGGALWGVSNLKRLRGGVVPSAGRGARRGRLRPVDGGNGGGSPTRGGGNSSGSGKGGFGQRFHDRWERRWEARDNDEG